MVTPGLVAHRATLLTKRLTKKAEPSAAPKKMESESLANDCHASRRRGDHGHHGHGLSVSDAGNARGGAGDRSGWRSCGWRARERANQTYTSCRARGMTCWAAGGRRRMAYLG